MRQTNFFMRKLGLKFGLTLLTALASFQASIAQDVFQNARVRFSSGKYTNKALTSIELQAKGATLMKISEGEDLESAHWMKFNDKVNWRLSGKDGKKTITVQFKDVRGRISKVVTDQIILDTTPPENPMVKIDIPGKYITKKDKLEVGVILSAKGAKFFKISNSNSFHGVKWQMLQDDYTEWNLKEGGDGMRKVYVQFRDVAGNESLIVNDHITVDKTSPFDGSIILNNDQEYTIDQHKQVKAKIFARQADSMIVALDDAEFKGIKWESYKTVKTIQLEGEDGRKNVFIKFKDIAGNESSTYKDDIYLDVTAPKDIKVSINGGAKQTNHINKIVTLSLSGGGGKYMMVSNDPSFKDAHWMVYRTKIDNWKLAGEHDGMKTVYAKFKDEAGNISSPTNAVIELNRGY